MIFLSCEVPSNCRSRGIYHTASGRLSSSSVVVSAQVYRLSVPVTMLLIAFPLCSLSFPVSKTFLCGNMSVLTDISFGLYADNMLVYRTYAYNFALIPVILYSRFCLSIQLFFDNLSLLRNIFVYNSALYGKMGIAHTVPPCFFFVSLLPFYTRSV